MWSLECRVGRLLELRIESPVRFEELESFGQRLMLLTGQVLERGERCVFCHDLRSLSILAPEVSDWFVNMMQRDNPRIERVGILLGPGATHALQIERMIKQAQSPARRTFREAEPLVAWLSEVLSQAEIAALQTFVSAAVPAG